MKDLLKKLDAHQVVNADEKRVELDNGMVVTYKIDHLLASVMCKVCLVVVINVRLGDGCYTDTAWSTEENRMALKWFSE